MKAKRQWVAFAIASAALVSGGAQADDVFAYPPEGRSKQKQQQDQFECHQWAVEQSKFDPVQFAAQGASSPGMSGQGAAAVQSASTQSGANVSTSAQGSGSAQTATGTSPSYSKAPGGPALVGGAAQGAAVASISGGDVGDGAAVGAGLRLLQQNRARKAAEAQRLQSQQSAQIQAQQQSQQQAQQAQQARQEQARQAQELQSKQQSYQRARSTCFKARGYTLSEG